MNMSTSTARRAAATMADPRWAAVAARDAAADGRFFYAVRTTGVYCRPSCGARTPRPENVDFFDGTAHAEQAGFRPCRRCRPGEAPLAERHAQTVARLCRLIDAADAPPALETLAAEAGLSPYHLHRVFKAVTGLTPRAYAAGRRGQRVREGLGQGATVTAAVYDAGFNSGGRFYAQADALLGMTPSRYRRGGTDERIRFALAETSLGALLVAASERGVCAIELGDDPEPLARALQDRFSQADLVGGDADFEALVAQVVAAVEAPQLGLELPLDVRGTAFQQRVWQALQQIPPGRTASYAEVARRIGAPAAVRAVAQACAANTLAVAIPCHRVMRLDGTLSGYRWGVERKRRLLEREACA